MENNLLKLFVVGNTPSASVAISSTKKMCSDVLQEAWHLEIIDVTEHPDIADEHMISAVPALLRNQTTRRVVGDLSDPSAVIVALGLKE